MYVHIFEQPIIMEEQLDHERVEKIAFVLKTIAHPMRVAIIDLLNANEKMSVNDITAYLGLEQSLTSHHLANMKMKGILGSKREGKNIFYFLKMREVPSIIKILEEVNVIVF
ncbi:ArsR family transcriptional regulator [Roseivirga pacifica]|uniref:Transcriptional regulator, ArsR family n=2 Tax=Roseivirga pacifica TaxID=1267423 RepID=A0A1I0RBD4_9BACT|nr:ArsR family transcriptional regulator [Roseivirga pacifica]SEW38144.1 transcriptional regulator, ArsR family [Roseivirga pacifica]